MKNKITVIGIGRLGLCFSLTLERGGYEVLGLDIREDYVKEINNKTFNSVEPNVNGYLCESKNFKATTDLKKALCFSNTIFATLRTESLPSGKYDHSQIENLLESLLEIGGWSNPKDLIICSNVCPGYSDEIQEKLKHLNYRISFNPEWVAQGQILSDQLSPDLVVIGEANKESGDKIEYIYKKICNNSPSVHRMDRLSAEITKIGLNCYLTAKITYANMIGEIAIQSGVDPDPILNAIGNDSRIGNKYFKYGFGYGGPCFPRDNRALIYYGNKIGVDPVMIKSVMEMNEKHLNFRVEQFIENLDKSKSIVFNSVTYKKGTTIIEESQQLAFAVKIAEKGYKVLIKEHPDVIKQVKYMYGNLFNYERREQM